MDGHIHNVQPISDHMMMDIKDGSLHQIITEEEPKERRKVQDNNQRLNDPEYAKEAARIELIAIAVTIVLILIFFVIVTADLKKWAKVLI